MLRLWALGIAVSLFLVSSMARAEEAPFEPDEIDLEEAPEAPPKYRPLTDTLLTLVSLYREEVGPRSLRRCPFVVSCSALAKRELEENGILGLFVFLDRFFYRENIDAHRHYPRRRSEDGVLLLDDEIP